VALRLCRQSGTVFCYLHSAIPALCGRLTKAAALSVRAGGKTAPSPEKRGIPGVKTVSTLGKTKVLTVFSKVLTVFTKVLTVKRGDFSECWGGAAVPAGPAFQRRARTSCFPHRASG
jgi:hypothetical protein